LLLPVRLYRSEMTRPYLRTSEISQAVGVHPNTVRLYEQWGFLPPIPRSLSGYRLFEVALKFKQTEVS
jgi:DNA-binding transcriptional MerR regulator